MSQNFDIGPSFNLSSKYGQILFLMIIFIDFILKIKTTD